MGAYLVDNPPARRQFRRPRRAAVTGGIGVHSAENTPDQLGPDAGAENVARFIARRSDPGSYHMLCDSDSTINLVPFDAEAYHDGTGSNSYSLSVSAATQAAKWNQLADDYAEAMTIRMAGAAVTMALWVREDRGIVVPGRWIPVADYRRGRPGFVRHASLDPGRRSDPGTTFPDDLFFEAYNDLYASGSPTPEDDDMTPDQFVALLKSDEVSAHLAAVAHDGVFRLLDEAANRSGTDGRHASNDLNKIIGDAVAARVLGRSGPRIDVAIQSTYLWAKAEAEAGNPRAVAALALAEADAENGDDR